MFHSLPARLAVILLSCGAAACELAPPTVKIVVEGPSTVAVGGTAQLAANVFPVGQSPTTPAASTGIEWSSSDKSRATVSAAGLVTGVAPGAVTIYALPVPFQLGAMGQLNMMVVQ